MGGKAVKDVRPLKQEEVKPTYEWVVNNMLPLLGLEKNDAIPIGSFGKKPLNETSGDIDIALDANKFIMEDGTKATLGFICEAVDCIFGEIEGYETAPLKGFDQVSVKVPINGDESNGYAQVDFMPSSDLKWAKFMYHSPNLAEDESKYKGAVRNALMMAIISESTKDTTKLFEGQTEEYQSLAIRFPTGVWDIKRSFMGKKGKIVKTGTVLESEFITKDPQDVIDLAFGPGYGVGAANSFETLWEVMHRKDFIHKHRMNEIMSKFKVNLKSMRMDTPAEAADKYPLILGEAIGDILQPKPKEDIIKSANKMLYDEPSLYTLHSLHDKGVLQMLDKDKVIKELIRLLQIEADIKNTWRIHQAFKKYEWTKNYIPVETWEDLFNKTRYKELISKYSSAIDVPEYSGQTQKELVKLEKELKKEDKKQQFLPFIKLLKGDLPYKSLSRIIRERIKRNQFTFFANAYNYIFKLHPNSHFPMEHVRDLEPLITGKLDKFPIADLRQGTSGRKIDSFLRPMRDHGVLSVFKIGNKQYVKANPNFRESEDYISRSYYKLVKELYDQIEDYNIAELNESIQDMFKPKTDRKELFKDARKQVYQFLPQIKNNQTPGIVDDLAKIVLHLLEHGYFYEEVDNVGSAWFKNPNIGPMEGGYVSVNGFTTLDYIEEYVDKVEKMHGIVNEELLAHVGDPFDPIGLYKNPQRIKGFDEWVKAFLDTEGNMYIEDMPNDWLHKDMAEELRREGKLNFRGNFYENPFVPIIRVGHTNNFAYTEGTQDNMVTRDIMSKAQKKFPQYKFFMKHHEDVPKYT